MVIFERKGGTGMYDFLYYQARDVMTSDPVTVDMHVTVSDVEAIFEQHDFNGLPVVDDIFRLIGMMTKLDLLKVFAFTENSKIPPYDAIMGLKVSEVMTKDPRVVHPKTPLTRVLQDLIETGHKSLPVVEDGRVTGIVAREDIMKALRQASLGQRPARDGSE